MATREQISNVEILEKLRVEVGFEVLRTLEPPEDADVGIVVLVEQCGIKRIIKLEQEGKYINQEFRIMKSLHGKIPIPEVHDHGQKDGWGWILMEFVTEGGLLSDYEPMPQQAFYEDLRRHVRTMREHKMDHAGFVVRQGWFQFLADDPDFVCRDTKSFMDARMSLFKKSADSVGEHPLVLNHGDFHSGNIFISDDGTRVTSIIDWEGAGYYPDFYEFWSRVHTFRGQDWPPGIFTDMILAIFWTESVEEMRAVEECIDQSIEEYFVKRRIELDRPSRPPLEYSIDDYTRRVLRKRDDGLPRTNEGGPESIMAECFENLTIDCDDGDEEDAPKELCEDKSRDR